MFELAESLWNEAESEDWTIPTLSEVEMHRALFLEDLAKSGLQTHGTSISVWAIAEHHQTFVMCNLLTPQNQHATPENITSIFRGRAPESKERSLAYAVRIRIGDEFETP